MKADLLTMYDPTGPDIESFLEFDQCGQWLAVRKLHHLLRTWKEISSSWTISLLFAIT